MKRDAKGRIMPGSGSGRPLGTRNKLTARIIEDVLESWRKNGPAALEITFREQPAVYLRTVVSILPKELIVEDVMSDVSDEQLDELMHKIREHLLTGRKVEATEDNVVH
jgi:hypothetical protein